MNTRHIINNQRVRIQSSIILYKLMNYERLFILMASLMPLALYNVDLGVGWSADRVLLLFLILLFPLYYIKRKSSCVVAFVLVSIGIMGMLLSMLGGNGTEGIIRYLPSLLQSYAIFFIGAFVFKDNPRSMKILNLIITYWAVIFLLFSVYMLFHYYAVNSKYVPFPSFFGGEYSDLEHRLRMMRSQRLFLPFPSAPFLGAIAGFISLWGFIVFLKTKRRLMLVLGILMLCVTVLTLSRGPVLSFAVAFIFLLGAGSSLKVVKVNKQLLGVIIMFVILYISINFYQGLQLEMTGKSSINRLAIDTEQLGESRHLFLRLHALELYSQGEPFQLFFGQGLGAFEKSGVGAYSFSSYLTLLVEVGFVGAFILSTIIALPLLRSGMNLFSNKKQTRLLFLSIFSMTLFIALAHLFYEFKTLQPLWLLTSFVFGLSQSRFHNLITAESWLYSFRNPFRS